ncbi:hypothetical protein E2C01_047999 [Portunus trituberculatus]|uniref:Uncharacterized protein n=1 Tax=Portunus trituberculatus TaxID=210409 RepID=A0A5B7G548_PORTR|nr:hypothetical protein [Portunus trituberculatus]
MSPKICVRLKGRLMGRCWCCERVQVSSHELGPSLRHSLTTQPTCVLTLDRSMIEVKLDPAFSLRLLRVLGGSLSASCYCRRVIFCTPFLFYFTQLCELKSSHDEIVWY